MSEDRPTAAVPAPPPAAKTPVPHPWLPLLLGLAGLTVAAIVCIVLVVQFFNSRTINLSGYSQQMADNLEQLLAE